MTTEEQIQQRKDRASALWWWDNLRPSEAKRLAKKYKPSWPYQMVSGSSSTIQNIWQQETQPL